MSGVDVLSVLAATASDNDCPCGHPACSKQRFRDDALAARAAAADLIETATALLETQDAVDNRETAGPNAEDYFVLISRRNSARHDFDAALANVAGGAA